MLFRTGLLLVILLFRINYSAAQHADYSVTHYTTDQGLPQNSIKSINFDKAGYCWLGTEMGLVRFDGANFKVFGSDNIRGIRSDRIRSVARDRSGDTYVEIDNGQQMAITIDQSGRAPFPILLKDRPMCFSISNNLAVAIPHMSNTLNDSVHAIPYGGLDNFFMSTPAGSVYLVMKNKIYYGNGSKLEIVDSNQQQRNGDFTVIGNRLMYILPGGRIKVWHNGVLQSQIQIISGPLAGNKDFISGNYKVILSSTGAYLRAGKTIYRIDLESNQLKSKIVLSNIDIPDIHTIYYHAGQQKYYIGTLTSGLYVLASNIFQYPKMTGSFRSQAGTKGGESIVCDRYLYNRDGTSVKLPMKQPPGATIYRDRNDVLYYGNSPELLRLKPGAKNEQRLFQLDSRPSGIIADEADSNRIWICTSLSVGNLYKDSLPVFKHVPGAKEGSAVWGFTRAGKDSFLLATQQGLKWYDWAHNRVFRSVLDSFNIHCTYVESPEYTWISTEGKGFYLYHNGKLSKLPYGAFNGLKTVHSFVDDGRGYFWLPTNNGLYKVSKEALRAYAAGKIKDVYYYSFSTQNSLRSNEFNGGSIPHYVWLKDSMLSLLSIDGPVWFYPNKIQVDYPDKEIYVDQMELNGVAINYPAQKHIKLDPDFNNLTLTISSPYFGNKENLQLVYQVEGIGTGWQPVLPGGKISINRMPSGGYKLIVRKMTGKATSPFDMLTFSLTVKPWFYNTWWFYATALVLIGLVTYLIIKLRIRILVERNRKLQAIIESQTEGLTRTVSLLSKSEEELQESNLLKDNIITMVLHDLRSPLRFLHLISRKTATRHSELDKQELGQRLVEINTSIAALSDFTEQFFGWATSQRKDFKVNKTWFDLQILFEEKADLYEDLAKINNNTLTIRPGNYQVYTDRNILSVILRNLLDNANKNTDDGKIFLYASYTSAHLVITVSDTGKGLRQSQVDAFTAKDTNRAENGSGSGYGSMIIVDLLEKIGGVLKIDTQADNGTKFHIWLDQSATAKSDGHEPS